MAETIINQYPEDGICYPRITINIRNKPCATTGTILDQYYNGESVIYDYVYITNKYVWISWISGGDIRVYMAVRDTVTGERFGDCADIPAGTGGSGNVEFLNLHPHMQRWAVYNQNGPYTSANAIGMLEPAKFGGLSYAIVGEKGNDVYLIDTQSFGRCAIWAPRDNDSSITSSPKYNNGDGAGGSDTPSTNETIISEYPESGICYPQMTINVRSKPCASTGEVLAQYYVGENVIYDYVVITNKYVWISYISYGGRRVYMTVRDIVTGERWGVCDDIPGNGRGTGGSEGSDPGNTTSLDIVKLAKDYIGVTQYSAAHRNIIDTYNTLKPLPVGYRVTYSDDWCDVFITFLAMKTGALDIIGAECGVQRHIDIFKAKGIWIENGEITPEVGDIITFNWDAFTQPNNGYADHIGIVEAVKNGIITTIEGNSSQAVRRRTYPVGHGNIRGYARPKYKDVSSPDPDYFDWRADAIKRGWGPITEEFYYTKTRELFQESIRNSVRRKLEINNNLNWSFFKPGYSDMIALSNAFVNDLTADAFLGITEYNTSKPNFMRIYERQANGAIHLIDEYKLKKNLTSADRLDAFKKGVTGSSNPFKLNFLKTLDDMFFAAGIAVGSFQDLTTMEEAGEMQSNAEYASALAACVIQNSAISYVSGIFGGALGQAVAPQFPLVAAIVGGIIGAFIGYISGKILTEIELKENLKEMFELVFDELF